MSNHPPEYEHVRRLISRVRRRWRAARLIGGMMSFLACALLATILALCIALLIPLTPAWRAVLSGLWGISILAAATAFLFVRLFGRTTPDERLALLVEAGEKDLHNEVINALRLAREDTAAEDAYVRAALKESGQVAAKLSPSGAVSWREAKRGLVACLALSAAGAAMMLFGLPQLTNAMKRLAHPFANLPKVGRFAISDVKPGDAIVLAGDGLRIEARVIGAGNPPDIFLQRKDASGRGDVRMQTADGALYSCDLADIRAPFAYSIAAGSSRTRDYQIQITERPIITRIALSLDPPQYTGLPASRVADCAGVVAAPIGSSAAIEVDATKPLRSAVIRWDSQPALSAGVTAKSAKFAALVVTENRSGQIEIEDTAGYRASRPIQVQAVADLPPVATIALPGKDATLALGDALALSIRGVDDYGIVRAELVERRQQDDGGLSEPRVVHSWTEFSDAKNVAIQWSWRFDASAYRQDETVRYSVRMVDGNPVTPGVGASADYAVRLEDPAAQRAGREQEYRGWEAELQKLLQEQRDLRRATDELLPPVQKDGTK